LGLFFRFNYKKVSSSLDIDKKAGDHMRFLNAAEQYLIKLIRG